MQYIETRPALPSIVFRTCVLAFERGICYSDYVVHEGNKATALSDSVALNVQRLNVPFAMAVDFHQAAEPSKVLKRQEPMSPVPVAHLAHLECGPTIL